MKNVPCQLFVMLVALAINIGFASCASAQEVPKAQSIAPMGVVPYTSGKKIVIDITTQLLYVLDGNMSLMMVPCGTGSGLVKDLETIPGNYKITTKEGVGRTSHLYKGAPMPYAMQLDATNMFIHGSPDFKPLRVDNVEIGIPQSHACIRMFVQDAKRLSELVSIGTPVKIIGSTGEFVTESDIVRRLYDKLPDGSYKLKILSDPSEVNVKVAREAFFNRQILVQGAKGKNPIVGMPFLPPSTRVALSSFEAITLTEEEKFNGKHLGGGYK